MAADHIEITNKSDRDLLVLNVQAINHLADKVEVMGEKMDIHIQRCEDEQDRQNKDIIVLQTKSTNFVTWRKLVLLAMSLLGAGGGAGAGITKLAEALSQTPPS